MSAPRRRRTQNVGRAAVHNGQLQHLAEVGLKTSAERTFTTGIELIDALAPGGALVRGAVHELLSEKQHGQPRFFAATLASAAVGAGLRPALASRAGAPQE